MKAKYLLPLLALALAACDDIGKGNNPPIKPEPAKTTPPDAKFNNMKVETLSKEVRTLLGATEERDLVIVVKAKGGTVLYGARDHGFIKAEKDELDRYLKEALALGIKVEIVNNLTIKTLRASPECEWYEDGAGNTVWYLEGCPRR